MWWELLRLFLYTIPIGVMIFVVMLCTSAASEVLGRVMRIGLGPMSRWSRLFIAFVVFVCTFTVFIHISIQRIANDLFEIEFLGDTKVSYIVYDDKYVHVAPIVRTFTEVLIEQHEAGTDSLEACRKAYWADRSFRIRPCIEAIGDPRLSETIAQTESFLGPINDNNLAAHLEETHFLLVFKMLDYLLIQRALIDEITSGMPFIDSGIGYMQPSFQLRTYQKDVRAHLDRFSTYSFCFVLFFSTWIAMIFFGGGPPKEIDEDDDDLPDFENIDA